MMWLRRIHTRLHNELQGCPNGRVTHLTTNDASPFENHGVAWQYFRRRAF